MSTSPRLSSLERRNAILEAAIRLFSERGFRGVTTRELAASVGVSEPVLYQHFPSKKDLYKAIIEASMDQSYYDALQGLERQAAVEDDDKFFLHLAKEMFEWHRKQPELIRLKMFSALEGHELMEEFHERQARPFVNIISGYIERRMKEGAFVDANPLAMSLAFAGMVGQYCQNAILFKSAMCAPLASEATLHEMVNIFLNGIRKVKS